MILDEASRSRRAATMPAAPRQNPASMARPIKHLPSKEVPAMTVT